MEIIIILIGVLVIIVALLSFLLIRSLLKLGKYRKKYAPIIDIDEAVEKSSKELHEIEKEIEKLRSSYQDKKKIYDQLLRQVAIYDEDIELAEFGFYKPHFDFDTSEKFKEAILKCKEKQKEMVHNKQAVYCTQQWTVDGSKAKGTTMTNRNIRLTSRAFNSECDSVISNVRWNNIVRFEERLNKAKEAIDKMNASNKIFVAENYLSLKIEELRLTHEYKEKKQNEKEEQAEIRRQMREEAKLQQEAEAAEQDEQKYQNLLNKARNEAGKLAGEKLEQMKAKMAMLKEELKTAHEKNERAKSMAQQTKAGHVYIISNIGSFGKNVYKIGMTRRLEPHDRVKELGDASVPFAFDVHAMIKSDDAPHLEKTLHTIFDEKRLNLVNSRKEFFNTNLTEIEAAVYKNKPEAEFILTAEAREFKESESIRNKRNKTESISVEDLPDSI